MRTLKRIVALIIMFTAVPMGMSVGIINLFDDNINKQILGGLLLIIVICDILILINGLRGKRK